MHYFPFFFDLRGRRTLVVGGGEVALRKAELLAAAGAKVSVVAPQIIPALATFARKSGGKAQKRPYSAADIDDCIAVVSATDDESINQQVSKDARAKRVPVNVVDNPALCDFIFPAIINRAPVVVAVSSGGASPVLARRIRAQIEETLPATLGQLCDFCARFRSAVKNALPMTRRRLFWEEFMNGAAAEAALNGDDSQADTLAKEELRQFAEDAPKTGEVYLIGAGPGDPDLLTFRAHRLLQKADVVVYDRLASAGVLALARRDAEKIFVGKRRDCHAASQDEINNLLINYAEQGMQVARLKGGDPFVFGRGGEEMLALRAANIPFQIVPGITAAAGCAAAAGIPLTHRGAARSVRFCTAYRKDMNDANYWRRLAEDADSTLAFYMAGAVLSEVAENLISAGRSADTPAAVICAGTTAAQQAVFGVLSDIAEKAKDAFSPAMLIVGESAALHAEVKPRTAELPFTPVSEPAHSESVHAVL